MKPMIGTIAPDFNLPSNRGTDLTLKSLLDKNLILYFYPKDDTPGCTIEACSFRDIFSELTDKGYNVIGISRDDTKSHEKFTEKYHLPFTLLSDFSGEVTERYGVWVEKNNYGKKYMGIERTTFLVNTSGIIEKVWEKVSPDKHINEILDFINKK